jgi:arylsulfatase
LDHPKQQKKHAYLYWEFPGYGGQQAVRMGRWKGIIFHEQKGDTTIKLFDLIMTSGNSMMWQRNIRTSWQR